MVSRATIARYLTRHGLVVAEPKKKPKSSYIRFAAEQPNECWQADFTHYRLIRPDGQPGRDCEILTWLDDHSRYALSVTAHVRVTGPIVLTEFRKTVAEHGIPASTLTDNGMVFTTRLSGGRGGRNAFEHELRALASVESLGGPAVLIGNSMGAGAAVIAAATRPANVSLTQTHLNRPPTGGSRAVGTALRPPRTSATARPCSHRDQADHAHRRGPGTDHNRTAPLGGGAGHGRAHHWATRPGTTRSNTHLRLVEV